MFYKIFTVMKKIFFLFFLATVVILAGCQTENSVNPQPELGKATITGKAFADTNLKNAGDETAPVGTKVVVMVNGEDLAVTPDNTRTYGKKYYSATVDPSGKYSIDVEVGALPIRVSVAAGDFIIDVTNADNTVTKDVIFSAPAKSIDIYKDGVFYLNLSY